MKVGDLVTFEFNPAKVDSVGIVTCIHLGMLGGGELVATNEVEVLWNDGDSRNHSTIHLELLSEG